MLIGAASQAQVPQIINYQGRVSVGGALFTGTGQFSFALVSPGGTNSFWSNDGSSTAGSQPTTAVPLPVNQGLYSVLLGDMNIVGMTAIPTTVFSNNSDVRLRIWFNDGIHGFQQLAPDQRIASAGYAMVSGSAMASGSANVAGEDSVSAQIVTPLSIGGSPGTGLLPINVNYQNGPSFLNGTLGTFKAGRSGAYLVTVNLEFSGTASFSAGEQIDIGVQGSTVPNGYVNVAHQLFFAAATGNYGMNGSALVPVTAGDVFVVVAQITNVGNGASNPLPVNPDGRFSHYSIVWVGN